MQIKNYDPKRVIISDVDGVLLSWEYAFNEWMQWKGYEPIEDFKSHYSVDTQYGLTGTASGGLLIREFNESAAMGFIPPLRDSQYYVKLLNEKHQYHFVCLTSLSSNPYAAELRRRNLVKLFGDIFLDVICLDTGADKDEDLTKLYTQYGECYWIEDKPENADAGIAAGFKSLLVEHKHNLEYKGSATVVKNWKEIYNIIKREN